MSSIFDTVFPAIVSSKTKTTPIRRAHRHLGALLLAACFALGCGSEPEASVFPACDGPFDVPSWWKSFPSADIEGLALDPQGAILIAHREGYGPDPFQQELVKLNANGEAVWTKSLAKTDINWLTTNDEGDIFLGGIANFGASSPFG